MKEKRSIKKTISIIIGLLIMVVIIGAIYFLSSGYDPMEEALAALESTDTVTVMEGEFGYEFIPIGGAEKALIYYPGGLVDHRAYAPFLHQLAEEGIAGFLVQMPFDLAILGSGRAGGVMKKYEAEIDHWVIGGHSLGGAMAARYVDRNPEAEVEGLILFASYPGGGNDLSGRDDLSVLSIYGTRDGLVSEENFADSPDLLPPETVWLEIPGGNHSQFGYYGFQDGDLEAEISREEQHQLMIEGVNAFFQEIGEERIFED